MTTLALLLPPRPRIAAAGAGADTPAVRLPLEWSYALLADDGTLAASGTAPATALPPASRRVLVLAEGDVAFHRLPVPKAPAARLEAAIAGAIEELVLDDTEALHVALAPGLAPGATGWVAALHKPWFIATLSALEAAGLEADGVVPGIEPLPAPDAHVRGDTEAGGEGGSAAGLALVLAGPDGVSVVGGAGSLARALWQAAAPPTTTAAPAAAAAAQTWLGAPVRVATDAERAAAAVRRGFELRQFGLAPRRAATRALRDAWLAARSPAWRPVRWGLAALVLLQLVGLNAYAWQQQRALAERRAAMEQLLRDTHPQVRAVLDPPLQMQRETERLRAAAGRSGGSDFEALLGAAAAGWPADADPPGALRYDGMRLELASADLDDEALAGLAQRLAPAGFAADRAEGGVAVRRGPASPGALSPPPGAPRPGAGAPPGFQRPPPPPGAALAPGTARPPAAHPAPGAAIRPVAPPPARPGGPAQPAPGPDEDDDE
jgi:general secretion pathway protein L